MSLSDELQKLSDLRQAGDLSDAEFGEAKRRLLSEGLTKPATGVKSGGGSVPSITPKRYRSSRWSSGNLFFPDTLTLASDGMLFRKGALFGSSEEHISFPAVASFKVTHGIFLSNILVETTGGSQPIYMNGLWKSKAKQIQETLRQFQVAA